MPLVNPPAPSSNVPDGDQALDAMPLLDHGVALIQGWRVLLGSTVACAALAYACSYLITPTFTGRSSFLSPQPQQNSAAAALASLGALSGLSGTGAARTQGDQYIALMQSVTLSDRMIDRFGLIEHYDVKYRVDARRVLADHVRIALGKKDNLIVVEVEDTSAERAADMANAYVDELKKFSNTLSLTEAQQRRSFFEDHLAKVKNALTEAQAVLQRTGFDAGALQGEIKTAADSFAKLKAEIAATEVRIGALSRSLTDSAPEMQRARATLEALNAQLRAQERPLSQRADQNYLGAYREFKYQEALFDIYARQFELAKLDEARDGAVIQVIDKATPAERRSKPRRLVVAALGAAVGLVLGAVLVAWRRARRHSPGDIASP